MGKLGDILRTHGPEYRRRFEERMSLDQIRAMHAIETCHTPAAGSALWRCTSCGHGHFTYQVYISESAILQHDEKGITLRYRKSETNQPRTLRLEPMEFLRRFLQHVLPQRFCKVRHYGLHHSSKRGSVKLLQAAMSYALGVDLPKQPEIEQPPPVTCPKCEAVMTFEKRYTQRERLKYLIAAPRGPPS